MRLRTLALNLSLVCLVAGSAFAQSELAVTRGPYLQSQTPESIVIRWRTATATDSVVRYGTQPDGLDRTAMGGGLPTREHEVLLSGLQPGTRYYYTVGTSAAALSAHPDQTFETAPEPGTRKPVRIWTFGDSG